MRLKYIARWVQVLVRFSERPALAQIRRLRSAEEVEGKSVDRRSEGYRDDLFSWLKAKRIQHRTYRFEQKPIFSEALSAFPGTYVPGFRIPPLRGCCMIAHPIAIAFQGEVTHRRSG